MKKKLLVLFLIFITIASFGCGAAKKSEAVQESPARNVQDSSSQTGEANLDLQAADQKVIKNAEINITVKDNRESEAKVQVLVAQYKGFIQNTESYQSKESNVTNLEVRIPAASFESFLTELKNLGEVTHNRVYTTDVTEEYIDLSARQKTLLLQEERLQEMLKKAKDVDELLKVENELARIRGEIERITGRLNYLDNKISYSTIQISLRSRFIAGDSNIDGFGAEVLYSLKTGFNTFLAVVMFLIKALMFALPFLVVILPLLYLYYKKGGKISFRK